MGYSTEYHVERYLREVLVPRIGALAPRFEWDASLLTATPAFSPCEQGDDSQLHFAKGFGPSEELLDHHRRRQPNPTD